MAPPPSDSNPKRDAVFVSNSNVLTDISKFLDVASIVRLSRTRRSLRESLTVRVDDGNDDDDDAARWRGGPTTTKLKVASFAADDPTIARPRGGDVATTRRQRCCRVAADVLSEIHFPSLERLEFRLPPPDPDAIIVDDDEGARVDAFAVLATGLADASALEDLRIDVESAARFASFRSAETRAEFAANLAGCQRLRRIAAFDRTAPGGQWSRHSWAFLRALLPAVRKGVDSLEEVTLLLGGRPGDDEGDGEGRDGPPRRSAVRELFEAVLRLRGLRALDLQLNLAWGPGPLLNEFLLACETVGGAEDDDDGGTTTSLLLPSRASLERFTLTCVLYRAPRGRNVVLPSSFADPGSLSPALDLLGGDCPALRTLAVRVPPACWDFDGVPEALRRALLSGKPRLRSLGLYFHGHECRTGRTLETVLDYVREREGCLDNVIHVSGLGCQEERFELEEALDRYYCGDGGKCLSWDEQGMKFQCRGSLRRW